NTEAGWARLLIEFRAAALRDPDLNARYAAAHARTIDELAAIFEALQASGAFDSSVPARALAQFILAFGAGLVLERAADPDALPWSVTSQLVGRAVGIPAEVMS